MIQTGLRVSEVTGLSCADLDLSLGPHIRCTGKGRKERATPLTKPMVKVLKSWLKENTFDPADSLFPNVKGGVMSVDAVQYLLTKYAVAAGKRYPPMAAKRLSPHVLRHTAAMQLLDAGVDRAMIALWLGHESVETTQIYLEASLSMKQKLLASFSPAGARRGLYVAKDPLLGFLRGI
jgi:integrase/recombinase XerD